MVKFRPSILKTIPKELKLQTDEKLKLFLEEMILEDMEFVRDSRVTFLREKIRQIKEDIAWWSLLNFVYGLWIEEFAIKPMQKEIEKIEREIRLYENPTAVDYDRKITSDDIERARSVDCADLIEIQKTVSGRNWAVCPFHQDSNPSMLCYPNGRGYFCFACGAGGDSIDLVRKLHNYNFPEAVKYLVGR